MYFTHRKLVVISYFKELIMDIQRYGFWHELGFETPLLDPVMRGEMSLCIFVWRCVFGLLIGWPLIGLKNAFIWCLIGIAAVVVTPVAFLFAHRIPVLKSDTTPKFTVPIKNWPLVGGHRILPIWFVGVAYVAACGFGIRHICIESYAFVTSGELTTVLGLVDPYTVSMIMFLVGVIGIAAGLIIIPNMIINKAVRSEGWKILVAYIKAKKDKVCPMVKAV